VLATALSPSQAFVHDALATPTRGAWSVDATLAYTLAATADGGVIATVSGVGSSDEIVAIAVAQDGRERWRRALCRTDYSAPIVVDEAGNATIVACAPARIFQLAKDGTVTRDRPLALPGKGHVRVDAVATQGDRMVFAGQLHDELDFAGRTFAAWDVVEGGRKSGAGDVVVLVLAGDEIVAIAHGHGREADEVTGIAATHDGAVWVVGNARHELDFGDGKAIAADAHERGRGFVARIELAR
ncbi:MAG TPA: hypothetical protein VG755_18975, partial [Nannocystaceae bacterium]|nr:hypothetical protein [Nannocystaceae bacterium]